LGPYLGTLGGDAAEGGLPSTWLGMKFIWSLLRLRSLADLASWLGIVLRVTALNGFLKPGFRVSSDFQRQSLAGQSSGLGIGHFQPLPNC
jgi:hypothetical protein